MVKTIYSTIVSSEDNFFKYYCDQQAEQTSNSPEIRVDVNKSREKPVSMTRVQRRLRDAKIILRMVEQQSL